MKTSKYYGVSKCITTKSTKSRMVFSENFPWRAHVNGLICKYFKAEKEAARAVDIALMNAGKEPRNVLKRAAQ